METKIEVAVIERKPNDDLPRYIDNDECSHLVRVNPNKSYLLFDDDVIGLLAALEPQQIKRIIQTIDNNFLFHFADDYKEKLDPICTKILEMIIRRRQEGRYIDDRVETEFNF